MTVLELQSGSCEWVQFNMRSHHCDSQEVSLLELYNSMSRCMGARNMAGGVFLAELLVVELRRSRSHSGVEG